MEALKTKPEIRYADFTGAWEQRKLIDIAPLQRGFDLPVNEMQEGNYPVVMSNGVGAYHSKYKVKAPGVVTGRSGTIGNLTFVEADYWPHNTALWVTDFKGNDEKFVFYLYQELNLKRFGTGSGVPTLNRNDVHDTKASIPSIDEQKKIVRLFDGISNLITLHQREYDKMVNIKKAMLEKMFPKNGEGKPEIRFAGFTDAWEQRKLGELCNEFRSGDFIKADDIAPSGDYPVYGGNGFRGYTDTYNHDGDFALIGRQGALCGNMQFSCGKAYFTEHAVAVRANNANETRFLYYLFGTMNLGQYSGQSAQPGLAVGNLIELKNLVPYRAEQTKISALFSDLDHLITLHQRELVKLQNMKKALLEKMFA